MLFVAIPMFLGVAHAQALPDDYAVSEFLSPIELESVSIMDYSNTGKVLVLGRAPNQAYHSFLWTVATGDVFEIEPPFLPRKPEDDVRMHAMNDNGLVVGSLLQQGLADGPASWTATDGWTFTTPGEPLEGARWTDVNEWGDKVGIELQPGLEINWVLWAGAVAPEGIFIEEGVFGLSINDFGDIVGQSFDPPDVLWGTGGSTVLECPDAREGWLFAEAINNNGIVAGGYIPVQNGVPACSFWLTDGSCAPSPDECRQMYTHLNNHDVAVGYAGAITADLGASHRSLHDVLPDFEADVINDHGAVAGTTDDGAFALVPVASAAGSCWGSCGGPADGCYCDSLCEAFGDCCIDKEDACPIASCAGHCDGQAPEGCYCDDACVTFGDCCSDVDVCAL